MTGQLNAFWIDLDAGLEFLQPINNHPHPGLQTLANYPQLPGKRPRRHPAVFHLIVLLHHPDKALRLIRADGAIRQQQRRIRRAAAHPHAGEKSGA